jgi:hypothetical protein
MSSSIQVLNYNNKTIKFFTPNSTTAWRVKTIFEKEPITISWMNNIKENTPKFSLQNSDNEEEYIENFHFNYEKNSIICNFINK